jgi:REP element-mobilizing transposase RayT
VRIVPERLKRLDIVYQHFPIYFVTACTLNRQPMLANESIHSAFKKFGAVGPKYGAWIGAYVLMPDHFHLFVAIDAEKLALSYWVKSLKGTVSSVLRSHGNSPPYWQKGSFDHILRNRESYSAKWEYVRTNPVRGELVRRWEQWPFLGEIFDLRFQGARL